MKSWIESANDGRTDFPLENLPLGVFRSGRRAKIGAAIGDRILDLAAAYEDGLISESTCAAESLNELMARGPAAWRALRQQLAELLTDGAAERYRAIKHLLPRRDRSEEHT